MLDKYPSRLFVRPSRPSGARGQVVPAGLYKASEPAGQFANPVLLATSDGVRRNQFSPNAYGDGPRKDKIGRVLLIHAPGGD